MAAPGVCNFFGRNYDVPVLLGTTVTTGVASGVFIVSDRARIRKKLRSDMDERDKIRDEEYKRFKEKSRTDR